MWEQGEKGRGGRGGGDCCNEIAHFWGLLPRLSLSGAQRKDDGLHQFSGLLLSGIVKVMLGEERRNISAL